MVNMLHAGGDERARVDWVFEIRTRKACADVTVAVRSSEMIGGIRQSHMSGRLFRYRAA